MKRARTARGRVAPAVALLLVAAAACTADPDPVGETAAAAAPAVEPLAEQALRATVMRAEQESAGDIYALRAIAADRWHAETRAHGLALTFTGERAEIESAAGAGWQLRLHLARLGRRGAMSAAPAVTAADARENHISYTRGAVDEWYLNGPHGLEQGFAVRERPAGTGPLVLEVAVDGDLTPAATGSPRGVLLRNARGAPVLAYRHLYVEDATGRPLPAHMEPRGGIIALVIDDADATYPLDVDPYIQQDKLTASDAAAGDHFGVCVSISGGTAVVGAQGDDDGGTNAGSAYVFERDPDTGAWSEVQKLTASDAAADDWFGGRSRGAPPWSGQLATTTAALARARCTCSSATRTRARGARCRS